MASYLRTSLRVKNVASWADRYESLSCRSSKNRSLLLPGSLPAAVRWNLLLCCPSDRNFRWSGRQDCQSKRQLGICERHERIVGGCRRLTRLDSRPLGVSRRVRSRDFIDGSLRNVGVADNSWTQKMLSVNQMRRRKGGTPFSRLPWTKCCTDCWTTPRRGRQLRRRSLTFRETSVYFFNQIFWNKQTGCRSIFRQTASGCCWLDCWKLVFPAFDQ